MIILSRRLAWCVIQEVQSHWPKYKTPTSPSPARHSKSSAGKSAKVKSEGAKRKKTQVNLTHWLVLLFTVMVVALPIVRLIQNTSLFNLLFLVYPYVNSAILLCLSVSFPILSSLRMLLYLSLFGFTLEPRPLRARYQPPKTFLQHVEFNTLRRLQDQLTTHSCGKTQYRLKLFDSDELPSREGRQSTKKVVLNNSHSSSSQNCSNVSGTVKRRSSPIDEPESTSRPIVEFSFTGSSGSSNAKFPPVDDSHLFWETSLLLPAMPDEVRQEVDLLLSDLVVRLKQLLFNSLLCAYYVGFIPVQFSDVSS